MIVLLGATGYIGRQFAEALTAQGQPFVAPSRAKVDYTRFGVLWEFLDRTKPEFLINAAGYTGKPNVDACEQNQADTLQGNALFPATVAHACATLGLPWGHVSSGCIFSGAKVDVQGGRREERDLTQPSLQLLLRQNRGAFHGFTEEDEPNFTFRRPPCSFYSGTKALGEEAIKGFGQNYIWRLRIPFDQFDDARNYLSKLQNYAKVYDNVNSLSHRGDFVAACLELWRRRAPFGIYNVTNPGFVTSRQAVEMIQKILKPSRAFDFWASDEEFYRVAAKTPRSNCILDVSKLLATGVTMRPVEEALTDALQQWRPRP
ncbi:MAG TPA: sugar nucleotide-binding protein [Verrucomicrobiae bacterium]|jgi:dTDP-4-dehydrorhamnose reductase|nr:sugar nucleotide-binding protein [Verrucomicrobiae bacterium]